MTLYCAYNVHMALNCLKHMKFHSVIYLVFYNQDGCSFSLGWLFGCRMGLLHLLSYPCTILLPPWVQEIAHSYLIWHTASPWPAPTSDISPNTSNLALGLCEELILNWAPGLIPDRRNLIQFLHFISNIIAQFCYVSMLVYHILIVYCIYCIFYVIHYLYDL